MFKFDKRSLPCATLVTEDNGGRPRQRRECLVEDPTTLHEERLETVVRVLRASGAQSILDLGCGPGALLAYLIAEPQFTRIVGIDNSFQALRAAEESLSLPDTSGEKRWSLIHGSFTESDSRLAKFDAAVMVETLEHLDPKHLSRVEQVVFAEFRPSLIVITTPNHEYNSLFGMRQGELRHPDHRFEWNRSKFESWGSGVARRRGYDVAFQGIGPADPAHGCPTQMGVFRMQ